MSRIIYMPWFRLLVGALLLAATSRAAAQSQPALALTIVPTTYSSLLSQEPTISFSHRGYFHVLLTNISSEPVNIFQEWNSWGYYGLSFEITYPDGRRIWSTKKSRGWDKNFPSAITLAPHGYYVFAVDFGPEWVNSIRTEPKSDHGIKCKMRAIYSIEPTKDDMMVRLEGVEPVWSGTIGSEESAYTIWP